MTKRATTTEIINAMRILSEDLDDHVQSAACIEAADRLQEMRDLLPVQAEWLPVKLYAKIRRLLR
jgi:hypothetical protein